MCNTSAHHFKHVQVVRNVKNMPGVQDATGVKDVKEEQNVKQMKMVQYDNNRKRCRRAPYTHVRTHSYNPSIRENVNPVIRQSSTHLNSQSINP